MHRRGWNLACFLSALAPTLQSTQTSVNVSVLPPPRPAPNSLPQTPRARARYHIPFTLITDTLPRASSMLPLPLPPSMGSYISFLLPLVTSHLCPHLWSPLCLLGSRASTLRYDPVLGSQERLPAPHPSSSLPKGDPPEFTRQADPSYLQAGRGWRGVWRKGPLWNSGQL